MPTYDYRCNACDHEFELFQSMSESRKRKCPKCGKNALERLIGTGAAVLFKGSGFYETDYRSESYKKAAEADKKSGQPAKADGKSDTKADSKPSVKKDAKKDAGAGKTPEPKKSAQKASS